MTSGHEVLLSSDATPSDFYVKFHGPSDSLYEGGCYKIHVTLPVAYPYKSPSIGFCTPIFHPNVDEASGSVCLDVINQTWSPMYDLRNVFNVFLPQLLLYPNPADPLNGAAAALMIRDKDAYKARVLEHVRKHAMVKFSLNDGDESDDNSDDSTNVDCTADTSTEKDEIFNDEDTQDSQTRDFEVDDDEVMSDVDDAPSLDW